MFEDLADKTKSQLVDLGESLGLNLSKKQKKDDLIEAIESVQEVVEDPIVEDPVKEVDKPKQLEDKKNYLMHPKFAKFKKEVTNNDK